MEPKRAKAVRPVELAKATRPLPPEEEVPNAWRKELRFFEKRIAVTVLTFLVPIVCLGWNVFVEHRLEEKMAAEDRQILSEVLVENQVKLRENQVKLERVQHLVQELEYLIDRQHDDLLEIDEIFRQERQTRHGKHRVLPR